MLIKLQNIDTEQNHIRFDLPLIPDYSEEHEQFNLYDYLSDIQEYTENKDLEVVKVENFIKIFVFNTRWTERIFLFTCYF
ncbi:MAG: hypothetical protein ACOCV3_01560 [Halanaerobiales bacterium]